MLLAYLDGFVMIGNIYYSSSYRIDLLNQLVHLKDGQ